MRVLLVTLLLLLVGLAGCASEEPTNGGDGAGDDQTDDGSGGDGNDTADPSQNGTSGGGGSDDGNTTGSNGTVANEPPIANITANALQGAVPFVVNLTLSAEDDGAVTWNLTLDGEEVLNGTTLPAYYEHPLNEVGDYFFEFTVSDGEFISSANVTVAAVEPVPVHTVSGSTTLTGMPWTSGFVLVEGGVGAQGCLGFLAGQNGQDCYYGTIPASLAGQPYEFTETAGSGDYSFMSSCGATADVVKAHGGGATGEVPSGAGCVVMWNYGTGTGKFTLDVF